MSRVSYGLLAVAAIVLATASHAQAAVIVLDDFNVNEGHFTSGVNQTTSGNNTNLTNTNTADRITTGSQEGAGNQQLVINTVSQTTSSRLRHLSAGGTAASNTPFATTGGTDGWIGFALKTTTPGWNVQLWVEPAATSPATGINGGVPKNVIADGEWHIYEWNLDDNSGGANGWGSIAGIIAGTATVGDGNHVVDSLIFRSPTTSAATSTIFFDWLVINTTGTVSSLVPEPSSAAVIAIAVAAIGLRRRRA